MTPLENSAGTPLVPSVSPRRFWRLFWGVLREARTHSPRNPYWRLGFAWGLSLPLLFLVGRGETLGHGLGWEVVVFLHPWATAVFLGALGTLRERKEAEKARLDETRELRLAEARAENEKLRQDASLKTRFMAFVTHDLVSPLVAIRGYSEGILEERFGPLTGEQRVGLAVSVRNIDRLQSLIRQLGEYEHVDGGDFKLSMSDFDLVPLIHECLADFQPRIDQKHLTVHLRIPESLEVHADRDRIGRVLTNLIANALTFSPRDAVIRIGTYTGEEDGRVLVTVADHGTGIPTAAQKLLFSRYRPSGPGVRKTKGTGLGLAICKGILDAHDSIFEIVSSEGVGTTARFDLNLTEPRLETALSRG